MYSSFAVKVIKNELLEWLNCLSKTIKFIDFWSKYRFNFYILTNIPVNCTLSDIKITIWKDVKQTNFGSFLFAFDRLYLFTDF